MNTETTEKYVNGALNGTTKPFYVTDLGFHPGFPRGSVVVSSNPLESRRNFETSKDFCIVLTPEQQSDLGEWLLASP